MSKPDIIFIYSYESPFIQKDIRFLRERYQVKPQFYGWTNKKWIPFYLIRQLFSLLVNSDSRTSYIVMFAGLWSVLPVMVSIFTKRRCFIIVGGSDCVSFPEFNYGAIRRPLQRWSIGYSLKNCTTILPVSEQLISSDYNYFDSIQKRQGFKSFFPEIETPVRVIHNGYEQFDYNRKISKRDKTFISVARIDNPSVYKLKGMDLLADAARANPDCHFTIVGIYDEMVSHFGLNDISNLTCIPFIAQDELMELYKQSQFYLCLSISEGFPNALCEAMSCGCVPIGSKVSSIPFIIDSTGFIVERREPKVLNEVISSAISRTDSELEALSDLAQKRIESEFNLDKRKRSFFELIG